MYQQRDECWNGRTAVVERVEVILDDESASAGVGPVEGPLALDLLKSWVTTRDGNDRSYRSSVDAGVGAGADVVAAGETQHLRIAAAESSLPLTASANAQRGDLPTEMVVAEGIVVEAGMQMNAVAVLGATATFAAAVKPGTTDQTRMSQDPLARD